MELTEGLSVKNPVLPHGASSKEKAIWPFIPDLPSGASWLFHVKPPTGIARGGFFVWSILSNRKGGF